MTMYDIDTKGGRASRQRSGRKLKLEAENRLLRIEGELVLVGDAIKRSGVTRELFWSRWRRGVRTWEGLSK